MITICCSKPSVLPFRPSKAAFALCRGLFRPTDGRLFPPLCFRHSFSDSRKYVFYCTFLPPTQPYQRPHFCRSQFHISKDFIECGNPTGFIFVKIFVHVPGSPFRLNYHQITPFSLSAIHRSVTRSCLLSSKENYQRKLSGTPRFSRYSCLAFSRSSCVGAVLYFAYNSWRTRESNFCSNPCRISFRQSSSSIR